MRYFLDSIGTFSFWRYAFFSREAIGKIFGTVGVLYLFVNLLDTFKIYQKDKYHSYGLVVMFIMAIIYVMATRRPVKRIRYKISKKDLAIDVVIGDLFKMPGEIVVSSNSTFDTDITNGLIAANSLQGQFALQVFNGQTAEIDRQIDLSLSKESYHENLNRPGKKKEYSIGSVARVSANGKNYYLLAMSHMQPEGNAFSTAQILDEALEGLWKNFAIKGERGDIVIPIMGSGRGRLSLSRKKIIEKIAQSFVDASQDRIFSNRLTIVCHPNDASRFSLNLYQVRDYLIHSLSV